MAMGKLFFGIAQIWLPLMGLPAIYCVSKKSSLAPLFGLLGQPAWIYCALYTGQWGMLTLALVYTVMWVLTAHRWWAPTIRFKP